MSRNNYIAVALTLLSLSMAKAVADDAPELPAGVELHDYNGWPQSIFLNATETPVQAVIVPAMGGSLLHFSLNGFNVLFENPWARETNSAQADSWLGGYHGEAVFPGSQNLPSQSYKGWMLPGNFAGRVTNEFGTNAILTTDFLLSPDTGELGVLQRLHNRSTNTLSAYLRDRTECPSGGFILCPLRGKSRYPAGWAVSRTNQNGNYDGDHPESLNSKVLDGVLVIAASGDVTRLATDSTAGWVAYARGKVLLVKYFSNSAQGVHPDGGNTVEMYFDQRALELSPLSPMQNIPPGGELVFPEKWLLLTLKKEPATWEQARKLVRKIPRSPFPTN